MTLVYLIEMCCLLSETLFRRRFGGIFAIFPHLCTARFFGAVDPDLPRNQSEVSIFFSRLINHSVTTRRQAPSAPAVCAVLPGCGGRPNGDGNELRIAAPGKRCAKFRLL
ncbi:hypothetical protein AMECASPLE_006968 [Ameca splendens]|uniref:Secreted protein n=1 Tax=Ameca splendens TaxID=208324 RepID=A0ABV0XNN2_9TELE